MARLLFFCQSGKISPNLVTLEVNIPAGLNQHSKVTLYELFQFILRKRIEVKG